MADSAHIIGYSYDFDGEPWIDGIASYFVGCASYPSIGSDAAGNLCDLFCPHGELLHRGTQWCSTDGMSWNADNAWTRL